MRNRLHIRTYSIICHFLFLCWFLSIIYPSISLSFSSIPNKRCKTCKIPNSLQSLSYSHRKSVNSQYFERSTSSYRINHLCVTQTDNIDSDEGEDDYRLYKQALSFLGRGALVGLSTGIGVVIFKTSISKVESLFYESLADILPKPAFYWPLALYPILGSILVAIITAATGPEIRNGVDSIAQSIDAPENNDNNFPNKLLYVPKNINPPSDFMLQSPKLPNKPTDELEPLIESPMPMAFPNQPIQSSSASTSSASSTSASSISSTSSTSTTTTALLEMPIKKVITIATTPERTQSKPKVAIDRSSIKGFNPSLLLLRLSAAVATLGSGCSLGPEGPAVEIGTGLSRIFGLKCSAKEKHRLFLCGTASAVAAGFNAPITGVFFAIECGNRYLRRNTIKLDESAPEGPRADIAAIVVSASIAELVCSLGLHESNALTIQGNIYALNSPVFELSMYVGLGLLSGLISVTFNKLRDIFTALFTGESWAIQIPTIPYYMRPLIGGLVCGLIAIFYPQTLFVGYTTLDQFLAGKISLGLPLVMQLLLLKIFLTSFSLGSGLIGGIFAPSLFMGAAAGTAYQMLMSQGIDSLLEFLYTLNLGEDTMTQMVSFFTIANAPAYAVVGAAATLGSLFRAPLTSSMLMFELTQNHDIVLPVLVSTGLGGLFAELLSHPRKQW